VKRFGARLESNREKRPAERRVQEALHDRSRCNNGHECPQPATGALLQAAHILDVEVTTGHSNENEMIEPQVDEVGAITGIDIKTVTASAKVYGALERRGIDALIPSQGRAN
jgi:hypothetical protein